LAFFFKKKIFGQGNGESDFACIITVYKEIDISWPLVRSLLAQKYSNFHIYLVADGVEEFTPPINHECLTVLFPTTALHSKVASIHYVLERMDSSHSHMVIFDPDNLVPSHFLSALDRYHFVGYKVVQGKRIAKNMGTVYAALDALGEYFYDFTVRQVPFSLGSSSVIAGSGMSVRKDLYLESIKKGMEELKQLGVIVAEDKSLQLMLVNKGHRIAYAEEAIIFDEKIASLQQVSRQRSRWLNSYFKHSKEVFRTLIKGISKMDWNMFWFSLTTLMPPLFILVLSSVFLGLLFLFININMSILLGLCLLVFVAGFLVILLLNRTPLLVLRSIPHIPLFVFGQILGLLTIKRANKDFLATSHQEIMEIEEVWLDRKEEFRHLSHFWEKLS
jgi:cellulose synthase/poly-beta-1,6-N-acetylglucosamine synthase-like glycosyltransferase